MIYDFRITLDHVEPKVWRRVLVPGNVYLDELHAIFQLAMAWESTHMYSFEIGGKTYMDDPDGEFEATDPESLKVKDAIKKIKEFSYHYDFGDGWTHTVEVLDTHKPNMDFAYPLCTGGENACPPEDCGGPHGYASFLKAISDAKHEEHSDMLTWVGGHFDPKGFDSNLVNRIFRAPSPQEEMDMFLDMLPPRG